MELLERLTARHYRTDAVTFAADPSSAAGGESGADAATVTFHLCGIGTDAVEALMAAHPATTDQKRDARERHEPRPVLDADGFRAALLAATCQRVTFSDSDEALDGLTVDEATAVLARFSIDDKGELQARCLRLDAAATLVEDG